MNKFLITFRKSVYMMLAILGGANIAASGNEWTFGTTFGLVLLVVCSTAYTHLVGEGKKCI
jgi:uncharacterized membrane protein